MLLQISIRNFAIFKDTVIEPEQGYNAVTGESGAGKSVVVNALSLICGARAYKEMIRTGEESASVEAVFRIPSHKKKAVSEILGIEEELLVITRILHKDKPSICKINGKIRNLSLITEISELFIDIHGQYENQTLLNVDNHIKYLDDFAGDKLIQYVFDFKKLLKEYNKITDSILSVTGGEAERERNRQILEFQIEEIESAGLENVNENQISERKNLLENAEKYRSSMATALNILENEGESITDSIRSAIKELEILPHSESLQKIISNMNESFYQLQDSTAELGSFSESIEYNESEYEQLLDRIEKLNDLKRKYGSSVDEILAFKEEANSQLNKIVNFKKDYARNLEKLKEMEISLEVSDNRLSDIRKQASSSLIHKLLDELNEMGMKDSVMEVNFEKTKTKNALGFSHFPASGRDICEFLISLNKGLAPVTLGKVASGGELSRIMLSFKTVFSYKDDTETVVFDEIDSGISGEASIAVADKLNKLSKDKQIICITHQPQIAAKADNHFYIKKVSSEGMTNAIIKKITDLEDKVTVIASLTDGERITKEGRDHAIKILKENKKYFN